MRVREIMTHEVAAVMPDICLDRAASLMRERNCGCLPVVNGARSVVGMLTDRDVVLAALRTDRPLSRLSVASAMTTHAFTCRPEDTVLQAERLMGLYKVRRLPVVDGGRLVGLLSVDDIPHVALREEEADACGVGHAQGEITRQQPIEEPSIAAQRRGDCTS